MTIGKNQDGTTTITLSKEESIHLENGVPIIKPTSYRRGIVQFELVKKQTCPTLSTQMRLKELELKSDMTISGAIDFIAGVSAHDYRDVLIDLTRFEGTVGGEVLVSEIV